MYETTILFFCSLLFKLWKYCLGNTNKSKLKTLLYKQKHGARIINFKDKLTHAEPLLQELQSCAQIMRKTINFTGK